MSASSAVGVYDYFASGKPGVAVRATDDKLARRIHVVLDVAFVEEGFDFGCVHTFLYDAQR